MMVTVGEKREFSVEIRASLKDFLGYLHNPVENISFKLLSQAGVGKDGHIDLLQSFPQPGVEVVLHSIVIYALGGRYLVPMVLPMTAHLLPILLCRSIILCSSSMLHSSFLSELSTVVR
jgi:hypothetical protein